jgi:Ca-activated chloride channel family protein
MLAIPRQLPVFLILAGVMGLNVPASGQGILIDRRPGVPITRAYEIREVRIDSRIRDQVAEVQVSQTFYNPGSAVLESEYVFPLPEEAAIQNFVLLVDGKELPGRLLAKEEARRIYEEIVRTKRDPALLEYMGRGMFRTSIFPIPPGAERKVTLRYTHLLKRDRDVIDFTYPLSTQRVTSKPIQRLEIVSRIESREPIKSVYSPTHGAVVERSGDNEARVRLAERDVVPTSDFRVIYTLARGAIGATLFSHRDSEGEDGYFLLLASPEVRVPDQQPKPKTVICVLDRSGSMSGKKIEQARGALRFVLENLREGDTFNIVVYDDRVESFKPELQRYTPEARTEAIRYVENIQAGGSTNIDEALRSALGMLRDDSRPSYVLFLTDGLPTAGETRELAIAENAKKANGFKARVVVFGVGFDVNARLLDRISGGNGGTSEYVTPDQDIEAAMSRVASRLTSPALAEITVSLAGVDVNRTYPRDLPDLFEGGQLVWVGRYRQSGPTTVEIRGKVGGELRTLTVPVELARAGEGRSYEFVERLWAVRRVGYLIDQIDLNGQNKELTDELVQLSTKYGILTPYTSFLADEGVQLHARVENLERARGLTERLHETAGAAGVSQRAAKQMYLNADRFAAAAAPAAPAAARGGGIGGGGLGGLPAHGGQPGGGAAYVGVIVQDTEGKAKVVQTVRQVGAKTFFRKGDRWVDSAVTPELEQKAVRVEQFSEEYFKLAKAQTAELNQYLTFEEPVTVLLDGRVYQIDRPKPRP